MRLSLAESQRTQYAASALFSSDNTQRLTNFTNATWNDYTSADLEAHVFGEFTLLIVPKVCYLLIT